MTIIRQAIVTKYLGATVSRPPRIKATAVAGSIALEYDDGISADKNHIAAAKYFAEKFQWPGVWRAGGLPDGHSRVFVSHDARDGDGFAFETPSVWAE